MFVSASTGPSNDLEQISRIARSMVTRWGMSDELGPITYGRSEELVFLGREISQARNYSEATANAIDEAARRIVSEAEQRAYDVLSEHRALLDHLAATLLDCETLQDSELDELLTSVPPPGSKPAPPSRDAPARRAPARRGPLGQRPRRGCRAGSVRAGRRALRRPRA